MPSSSGLPPAVGRVLRFLPLSIQDKRDMLAGASRFSGKDGRPVPDGGDVIGGTMGRRDSHLMRRTTE
jgi:hypothetical protein